MSLEKQTFRSGPFKDLITQGTRMGDDLYLSGQVGMGGDGKAGSDIVEQTRLAYQNIQAVLAEFGATMEDIVDETVFVTDLPDVLKNADAVYSARAEAYGRQPEVCQTLVQVSGLVLPELMIEIKCVAKLG